MPSLADGSTDWLTVKQAGMPSPGRAGSLASNNGGVLKPSRFSPQATPPHCQEATCEHFEELARLRLANKALAAQLAQAQRKIEELHSRASESDDADSGEEVVVEVVRVTGGESRHNNNDNNNDKQDTAGPATPVQFSPNARHATTVYATPTDGTAQQAVHSISQQLQASMQGHADNETEFSVICPMSADVFDEVFGPGSSRVASMGCGHPPLLLKTQTILDTFGQQNVMKVMQLERERALGAIKRMEVSFNEVQQQAAVRCAWSVVFRSS
eukprot:jgi/Chlat1/7355/Chrsp59S00543